MIYRTALAALALLMVSGCACPPSPVMFRDETLTDHPSRVGATLSQAVGGSTLPPPPVYRVVHREVGGPDVLVYYAIVCPWPFAQNPGDPAPIFGVQLTEFEKDISAAIKPESPAKVGAGLANPSPIASATPYQMMEVTTTGGTGWIFLTGQRPVVKTVRVIGGADGTKFFCQVARNARIEYHRFALVSPTTTQHVDLSLCTTPDTIARTLDASNTLAVYSYDAVSGTGVWTPPTSTFGTGPEWAGMEAALTYALDQAQKAALP